MTASDSFHGTASQARETDLEQFFAHENQPEPPSLSSLGRIWLGKKSNLLDCIEKVSSSVSGDMHPEVAHVIDSAAIVNMRKPKKLKHLENMQKSTYYHTLSPS